MRIPIIQGLIDRRILVNFRVEPRVLEAVLPAPFRPHLVNGVGFAGICLIRLKQVRPNNAPRFLGLASENAAHRIAVRWETNDGLRTGVYIPRRDTSSRLNAIVGGRIFPGAHHLARFTNDESPSHFQVVMTSLDQEVRVRVQAELADKLPSGSVFASLDNASQFFANGSLGYSPSLSDKWFDGLELRSKQWRVEPLRVNSVESSFFQDDVAFPAGSVEFDCALLMRNIQHEWIERERIEASAFAASPT